MDNPQARPPDRWRDALTVRINRAASDGRISSADRDIRLGNVKSAQSRTELDLMNRDLDQLEASFPAAAAAAPSASSAAVPAPATVTPSSPPYGVADPDEGSSPIHVSTVATGSRRTWILIAVIAGVALLLAGGLGLLALIGNSGSDSGAPTPALPPAQTGNASPADVDDPSGGPTQPGTPSTYALNARGINGFLAAYSKKFGTSQVVMLVLYRDYAVVDVPVAGGKGRQAGWIYRRDTGWTTFGGVQAVFPGAGTIDTRQLAVAPLLRNIARARTSLKVATPTQIYVVVRFIAQVDQVPSVDIHVANGFNESGYLATRLNGTVVRAYRFGG